MLNLYDAAFLPNSRDLLGALPDVLSCEVTEERNGAFELDMRYPVNGINADKLAIRRVIVTYTNPQDAKARTNEQAFRIDKITRVISGILTVHASHIFYDTAGFLCKPGTAASSSEVDATLKNFAFTSAYDVVIDTPSSSQFTIPEVSTIRSWLFGRAGSLIDVYGGEWKYEMTSTDFVARLMSSRGQNRGARIKYGVNMTSFEKEEDAERLYSFVVAYWNDSDGNTQVISTAKSTGLTLSPKRVFALDCTSEYQEQPTRAVLNARAEKYIQDNNLTLPVNNIRLSAVDAPGEVPIYLCDTVTVDFEAMGVTGTVKCVKIVYDVLRNMITEYEFGKVRQNVADMIADLQLGRG
jgi:phage-related protein